MSLVLYIILFVLPILVLRYVLQKRNQKLPPGPPRLPIIGSLISMVMADSKEPCVALKKLSMKYGDIFSLQTGSVGAIAINGYEALTKVAHSEALLSHIDESDHWILEKMQSIPLGSILNINGFDKLEQPDNLIVGLLFSLTDFWAETRVFTQKILRKYGFNVRTKTGVIIVEELVEFCDELKHQMSDGELDLTINKQFNIIFFNVVWTMVTGKKYRSDDPRTHRLLEAMANFASSGKFGGSISQLFPELIHVFPDTTGFTALKKSCHEWRETLREATKEHRQNRQRVEEEPTNFLDEMLDTIDASEKPTHLLGSIYTEENSIAILQDLVIGGTETQSNFIKFFIRFLINYPEVQKRLHAEVDEVMGKDRTVNVDDFARLTYMQATMNEVLRNGNVVPVTPRKLLADWKLGEYKIPKGTLVLLNLWSGDNDDRFWKDASKFDPTRFLSSDGTLINTDKVMAFGFGKRKCIGEQVARTCLLLAMTTFIQQFSFHADPKVEVQPNKDVHGLTRDTVPFLVRIRVR